MLMEKRMYIALIFVAAFLCSYAQQSDKSTYLAHIRQADSLYMAGDPAGASRAFEAAFYQTEHIQPYHLYNAACAAAKAGDNGLAFDRLFKRIALEKEWYSDRIETDGDLQPLHADTRWQLLLTRSQRGNTALNATSTYRCAGNCSRSPRATSRYARPISGP